MDGLTGFVFDLWDETEDARALWRGITENDEPATVSAIPLFEIARPGDTGRLKPWFAETVVRRAGTAYEQAPGGATDVLNRGAEFQAEWVSRGATS